MDPSKLKGVLGLFRPKPAQELNVGRRAILGLPRQADEMLPSVVTPEQPPVVGALQKVIEDKMVKPTTRREFLEEGTKTAATSALRKAAPSLLRKAAKKLAEPTALTPDIDARVAAALNEALQSDQLLTGLGTHAGQDVTSIDEAIQLLHDFKPVFLGQAGARDAVMNTSELARDLGLSLDDMVRLTDLPKSTIRRYFRTNEDLLKTALDLTSHEFALNYGEHPLISEGRGGGYSQLMGDLFDKMSNEPGVSLEDLALEKSREYALRDAYKGSNEDLKRAFSRAYGERYDETLRNIVDETLEDFRDY
jgi:hypothetical protein